MLLLGGRAKHWWGWGEVLPAQTRSSTAFSSIITKWRITGLTPLEKARDTGNICPRLSSGLYHFRQAWATSGAAHLCNGDMPCLSNKCHSSVESREPEGAMCMGMAIPGSAWSEQAGGPMPHHEKLRPRGRLGGCAVSTPNMISLPSCSQKSPFHR